MNGHVIDRRRFLHYLVSGVAAAVPGISGATEADTSARVAAIQMAPKLGDVETNLAQAEQLLDEAIGRGAKWIVLPEMFTSAAAFTDGMVTAIRPIDGVPSRLMRDKAKQHGVTIGGSFLAEENGRVHNSFLLYLADGSQYRHDKDKPTYWRYRGRSVLGDDPFSHRATTTWQDPTAAGRLDLVDFVG